CHSGHETAGLIQRHADQGANSTSLVQRKIGSWRGFHLNVVDDVWPILTEYRSLLLAELRHAVAAHDFRHWTTDILSHEHKLIFVYINLRISASVHSQILAQPPHGNLHDLFRVCERLQGLVQVSHESPLFLGVLAFGDVGSSADNLANTAVSIPGEDLVPA